MKVGTGGGAVPIPKPPGRGGRGALGRVAARQSTVAAPPSADFTTRRPQYGGGQFGGGGNGIVDQLRQKATRKAQGEQAHAALTTADAATRRLIELTFNHDAQGRPTTPKFGSEQFIRSAAKSLASRPGKQGASSYFTLASIGLPMATIASQKAPEVLHYIDQAAKSGKPIVAPNVEFLSPGQRNTITAAIRARGIKPPAGASDSELVNALHQHKLGLGDIITNLPRDLASTAIGIPGGLAATAVAGGMAAGGLVRLATGHPVGNRFQPAAELVGGVKQQYQHIAQHPLAALEEHPAQTVAALLPTKALVGKVAGRAAEAGMLGEAAQGLARARVRPDLALPRVSAHPENPITLEGASRQPFAKAFENRAAQATTDRLIARSRLLQKRELDRSSIKASSAMNDLGYQARAAQLRDLAKATNPSAFSRVPKDEQTAAVFAHGQGVKPSQWLAYYEHRLTQVAENKRGPIEHQIKLWQSIVGKYGDNVTPPMQRIIDAARGAVAPREDVMRRVAGVPEEQLQARRVLTQNHVLDTLRSQIPADQQATHPLLEPAATEPFYVPHTQGTPELKYFLSRRSRNYTRQLAEENKQNTLALVQSGKLNPSMTAFTSKLARVPLIERGMVRMQDQVTRFGKPAEAGTRIPEGFVAVRAEPGRIVTLTDKGATAEKALHETLQHIGEDNAALKTALDQHVLIAKSGGTIPAGIEDAILLPDRVYKNIVGDGAVRNLMRHPVLRGAQVATDWWRYITLRLRPAWLAYNLVSNTGQALLGMASSPRAIARIPASLKAAANPEYTAALEKSMPELSTGGMQTALAWHQNPGSLMDTAAGRAMAATGRAARYTGVPQVVGGLGRLSGWGNIAHENFLRRAMYLHRALPEAKSAVVEKTTAAIADHLANNRSEQGAQETAQFLGNFSGGKQRPGLRLAMPFYKWYGFVIKLMLWDLPVHSPGRTALLAQLGRVGDEEYQKFGLGLSKTMAGAIPISVQRVKGPDGKTHIEATLLRTQGVNTASTLGGLSNPEALLRSMNPLATAAASAALGVDPSTGFTNRNAAGQVVSMFPGLGARLGGSTGNTSSSLGDLARVFLNAGWQSTPLAGVVDPQSGQAETNIPFSQFTGIGAAKAPANAFASSQAPTLGQRVASYIGAPYRKVDLTQADWNALKNETTASLLGFQPPPTGKTKKTLGGSVVSSEAKFEAWKAQHPEAAWLTRTEFYRIEQLLIEARQHGGKRTSWGQPSGFGSHRPDAKTPAALAAKRARQKTSKKKTTATTPSSGGYEFGGGPAPSGAYEFG